MDRSVRYSVEVSRPPDPTVPGRVLDAVTPLFYDRGVGAVGMAEVAAAAGYEDSFYFARQFKRIHGLTPHAYRTRN